jgi:RNA polymerase sigma-70 factor (ECF subfamily)
MLLWAVRDGQNRQAWGDFHRIYAPMVRNFAKRLGLTDADADDATQEILLLAHDSLRRGVYDPKKGRFRAWLYGIARKKALMAHRARRRPTRAQAVPFDSGVDLLSGLEDRHDQAQREIWQQEWRYAMLDEALRQLQPTLGEKVFQSFVLYAIEQWPVDKVADRLGISTSSVYVYKSRVLEAIREWTAQFEDDGEGAEVGERDSLEHGDEGQ